MGHDLTRPLEPPTREYIGWLESRLLRAQTLCADLAEGRVDLEPARERAASFVRCLERQHPLGV